MQTWKRNPINGSTTPNIERSKGERPAEAYVAAGYLPGVRFDSKMNEWIVISYGKVVASDSKNYLVPAGLAIDIDTAIEKAYNNKSAFITNSTEFGNVYTQADIEAGVLNYQGEEVEVGEPVVASFFEGYDASQTLNNKVGNPLGMATVNVWRQDGAGYDGSPMNFKHYNWSPQPKVAVLTRYYIELPVVASKTQVKFPGLTIFENDGTVKTGDMVSFNKESNYTVLEDYKGANAEAVLKDINVKKGRILGRVFFIDTHFPKDLLNLVRTPRKTNYSNPQATDNVPSHATNGLPDNLYYAGVTDPKSAKAVRMNLVLV